MEKVRKYTSEDYRNYQLLSSLRELYQAVFKYKNLIHWLTRVALTQQYKKSFLGIAWLIISPFFSVVLWVILETSGVLNPGDTKIPYAAYVFLSSTIWNFFIGFYRSISETYTGRGGELLQNNFPHMIIVIEKIIISIVNFAIPLLLAIIVLSYFDVTVSWKAIFFPVAILPLMLLGISLGLVFSVLKIVAVDFTLLFDNSLEVLKYISPVVFAASINNSILQRIMYYNPLTYLINSPRSLLLGHGFPDAGNYIICTAGAIITFLFSYRFFTISSPVVFEKITI